MKDSSPERPWLAAAAEWTSKVTTVAGQMVLPPLLGLWLDRLAGTVCLFLILGALLGFAAAISQLVQWVRRGPKTRPEDGPKHQPNPPLSPPSYPQPGSLQGEANRQFASPGPNEDHSDTEGKRE